MKTYNYTVSGNNIWTSFDHGHVLAENRKQALEKAIEELKYNFTKANDALKHCDNTISFTIDFNDDNVEISEL